MEKVLIKSNEEETGILYTYLISREDAEKILANEGAYHFFIEGGEVMFKGNNIIMIKTKGAPSFLNQREVIRQIEGQL